MKKKAVSKELQELWDLEKQYPMLVGRSMGLLEESSRSHKNLYLDRGALIKKIQNLGKLLETINRVTERLLRKKSRGKSVSFKEAKLLVEVVENFAIELFAQFPWEFIGYKDVQNLVLRLGLNRSPSKKFYLKGKDVPVI